MLLIFEELGGSRSYKIIYTHEFLFWNLLLPRENSSGLCSAKTPVRASSVVEVTLLDPDQTLKSGAFIRLRHY